MLAPERCGFHSSLSVIKVLVPQNWVFLVYLGVTEVLLPQNWVFRTSLHVTELLVDTSKLGVLILTEVLVPQNSVFIFTECQTSVGIQNWVLHFNRVSQKLWYLKEGFLMFCLIVTEVLVDAIKVGVLILIKVLVLVESCVFCKVVTETLVLKKGVF